MSEGASSVDGASTVNFVGEAEKAARSNEVGINRAELKLSFWNIHAHIQHFATRYACADKTIDLYASK